MSGTTSSNPVQNYTQSVGGLMKQAFGKDSGINGITFLNAIKTDFLTKFNSIWDKITDAKHELSPDDNIYVPVDQKTLIGTDFSMLYNGKISTNTLETDQGAVKFLNVKADYDTELRSGYCTSSEPVIYDALGTRDKAVYEITLLSKAYADLYDGTNTEDIVQNYGDTMNQYKSACEANGLNWESVLSDVSTELQTENYWYKKEGKADEFDMASKAHALMLTAAGPDFKDSLTLAFTGEFDYEDTISENGSEVVDKKGVLGTAGKYINKGTAAVTNAVGGAWSSIRNKCNELVNEDKSVQSAGNPGLVAKPFTQDSVISKDGFLSFVGNSRAPGSRDAQLAELTSNIDTSGNSSIDLDDI